MHGLKAQLDQIKTTYISKMINTFLQSSRKRFAAYEEKNAFKTAAVLNPRFKRAWCQQEKFINCWKMKRWSWISVQPGTQSSKGTTSESEPLMKRCKLFSYVTDSNYSKLFLEQIQCR